MRISDWSSDVCSSDLFGLALGGFLAADFTRFCVRIIGFGKAGGLTLEELGVDVHALRLKIRLFRRAGDIDLHDYGHFGVKRDAAVIDAARLDPPVEHDLVLRYRRAIGFQRIAPIARARTSTHLNASPLCAT